jgi:hypothetical protein
MSKARTPAAPKEAFMPPLSYIGVAILIVVLVAGGAAEKLPLVVYQWRALFLAVPCLLAAPGAYRIGSGLGARIWVGLALVSPALAFAAIGVYHLSQHNLHCHLLCVPKNQTRT